MLANPIVLIHGYMDVQEPMGPWLVLETTLKELNIDYLPVPLIPHKSMIDGADSTIKQIVEKYPNRTVHLFGHAMGGIIARIIAFSSCSPKSLGFKVATVTTFGTPHRGIKALDWVSPQMSGIDSYRHLILKPWVKSLPAPLSSDFAALYHLSRNHMATFNVMVENNPNVAYYSWAGETELPTPLFYLSYPSIRIYGPCDGLVNTDSAEWGTHLGTVFGADNFSIVCRLTTVMTIPHLLAAEKGRRAPVIPFDSNLLQTLTRSIEGGVNELLGIPRAIPRSLDIQF